MSLQVWLPLNGDLHNQGLSNITVTNNGATVNNNGKIGKCYYFNGSSQYLQLSKSLTNLYAGDFSWAIWLKPTDATRGIIFSEYSSTGASNVAFELLANRVIRVYWNSFPDWSTGIALTQDIWSHVAITRTGNTLKVYVNGELQATKSDATLANRTSSSYIRLGDDYRGGTSVSYMGYMNDARIYDHALSPKEVEEIAKGLVLHYKLDSYWLAENILTNSSGYQGTANWSGLVTASNENGHAYLIAKRTDTTSTSRTFCQHTAITSLVSSWSPGDKFTISGWYKVPSSETQETGGNMFIRWAQSSSSNSDTDTGFTTSTAVKDVWIRFENTYTVPPNFASGKAANFCLSAFAAQKQATVYWKDVKLEKGDKATPWCPAKTDTLYAALGYNGTTIYDSSGYSNNGTIVGSLTAAAGSPRYEIATQFPGSAYSKCTSPSTEGQTISVWAKWNSIPSGQSIIYVDYKSKTGLGLMSTGILCSSCGLSSYTFSKATIVANTWYHFVIVCPNGPENATRQLYINGIEQTATSSTSNWTYTIDELQVGKRSTTSDGFNGQLSDFRIYATALTADQIKELYNTSMSIDSNGNVYARELVEL